jgi:hypothetical protein
LSRHLPLAPGRTAGVIKPTLLDKAWSSDGWKMILRAALPSRTKKFRATNSRRQQSTIAANFVRDFACGGTGTARAFKFLIFARALNSCGAVVCGTQRAGIAAL